MLICVSVECIGIVRCDGEQADVMVDIQLGGNYRGTFTGLDKQTVCMNNLWCGLTEMGVLEKTRFVGEQSVAWVNTEVWMNRQCV